MSETLLLVLFNLFIVLVLVLDLGIFQRKAHFPYIKEALTWSIVWIILSLLFNLYIWFDLG